MEGSYSNYNSDKHRLNQENKNLINEIIETATEKAENIQGKKLVNSPIIKKILKILEDFIKRKKLIVYGGTAVNNILPKKYQFYNKKTELPDYDVYSTNALDDAKELADIYYNHNFEYIQAKSGTHVGTFKVYVNFFAIADITILDDRIFNNIKKETIVIDNIHYCPVNFLRMGMYYELSKPKGDVSRWEKVFTRLNILNSVYGEDDNFKQECINYSNKEINEKKKYEYITQEIFDILSNFNIMFIGLKSLSLISNESSIHINLLKNASSFDIICYNPKKIISDVSDILQKNGIKNIQIVKNEKIGEILPEHYFLIVNDVILIFAYQENGCYSYNEININNKRYKIGTIDTILYFYYAFIYVGMTEYDKSRLICMANILFKIQQKDILNQTGLLKRFVPTCYGKEKTLEDIKKIKYEKYKQFHESKKSYNKSEIETWFLKYDPNEIYGYKKTPINKRSKKNKKQRRNKTRKITYSY